MTVSRWILSKENNIASPASRAWQSESEANETVETRKDLHQSVSSTSASQLTWHPHSLLGEDSGMALKGGATRGLNELPWLSRIRRKQLLTVSLRQEEWYLKAHFSSAKPGGRGAANRARPRARSCGAGRLSFALAEFRAVLFVEAHRVPAAPLPPPQQREARCELRPGGAAQETRVSGGHHRGVAHRGGAAALSAATPPLVQRQLQ